MFRVRTGDVFIRISLPQLLRRRRRFLLGSAEAGDALEALDHEVHDLVVVRLLRQVQSAIKLSECRSVRDTIFIYKPDAREGVDDDGQEEVDEDEGDHQREHEDDDRRPEAVSRPHSREVKLV